MRDERHYDRPDEFLPFRFVNTANGSADGEDENGRGEDEVAIRKFTDLQPNFFLWGAAKKPW